MTLELTYSLRVLVLILLGSRSLLRFTSSLTHTIPTSETFLPLLLAKLPRLATTAEPPGTSGIPFAAQAFDAGRVCGV